MNNDFNLIHYLTTKREKGIIIWLCNIGAEKYWHNVSGGITNQAEDAVVNRVEEINLLVCRPQDILILREPPDPYYLEFLSKLGFSIPNILVPTNRDLFTPISELVLSDERLLQELKHTASKNNEVYFLPYAVTFLEEKIAAKCNLTIAGPTSSVAAQINDKIFNRQIAEKLGLPVCQGRVCSTVEEIRNEFYHLRIKPPFYEKVIIKEPFGASGKGLYIIDNEDSLESRLRLFSRLIKSNPDRKWLVEGWYEKKADLNYQLYIAPSGSISVFSIKQQLLKDSVYIGSIAPPKLSEDVIKSYQRFGERIGQVLFEIGYTGIAGVDSIIATDDTIIPIIEINGRFTLSTYISFINYTLGENLKILSRYFRIMTSLPLSYVDLCRLLQKEQLLYDPERKGGIIVYSAGTLPLRFFEDSKIYPGRVFTLVIANNWDEIENYNNQLERTVQALSALPVSK